MFKDGEVPEELKNVEVTVTFTIAEAIDVGLGLQSSCEVYRAAGLHDDADRAFDTFMKLGHEVEPHLRKYTEEHPEELDALRIAAKNYEWPEQ